MDLLVLEVRVVLVVRVVLLVLVVLVVLVNLDPRVSLLTAPKRLSLCGSYPPPSLPEAPSLFMSEPAVWSVAINMHNNFPNSRSFLTSC